jgi:prepilin-type N-terminal cleavage/methylation domain-containing protein
MSNRKGFTLLEMLLALSVVAIIAGITIPGYRGFQARNDLDLTAQTFVYNLRRAKIHAQGMDRNGRWGVFLTTSSMVFFQGTNSTTRDTTLDETTDIPSTITVSGTLEVVFEKFTGFPVSVGTTTFTSFLGDTYTIGVNEFGVVSY